MLTDAAVTLRNEGTGVTQSATTNKAGEYNFQQLNPGAYDLAVASGGFKKAERTNITVDVGNVVEMDVAMEAGGSTETVEVTTGVQQLQTTSASTGLIVEQKSIEELPLIYGNPFALESLAPGILPSSVNPNIHTYDSSTTTVSVNGSALNALEIKLDGAPDNRVRLSAYTPSTEFINQYKVETASYDATEGHSSGGFVNVSLKSGTNQFHGGAFVYYQNPTLNANPWSLANITSKPVWLREGGDVGGPIWKDRVFFFAGYEHSRQASPNVLTETVPTLAERGLTASGQPLGYYDFSSLYALDPKHQPGTSNSYQIYDPLSGHTVGTSTVVQRNPFAGNIIRQNQVSPIAQKILGYYPLPNLPGNADGSNNFGYAGAEPDYYYAYVVRADATLTSKQQIFGHFVQSRRLQPGKNAYFAPVSGTNLSYQNKGVAFGYTYVMTPATVLDAHLTWTRFVNQNTVPSQGVLNATTVGMPSYLVDGLAPAANAFPRVDVTGFTSLNSDNGVLSHDDVTLGSVQVSHLLRNHFLRGGFEYRMYNTNGGSTPQSNGRYQATGGYASANSNSKAQSIGFGFAELLTGQIDSSAITLNADFAVRSNYLAGWLQDDWKARPNLTVNLGLRYEYEGPDSERNNKANTYFDFGAVNPAAAASQVNYAKIAGTNPALLPVGQFNVNGGLRFAGQNGAGKQTYNAQTLNLLPRAGLAYEFSPKTVFRAGLGVFDDSLTTFYLSGGNAGSTTSFLLPQQGYSATTSVSGSADNGLTFRSTLANPFPTGFTQVTGSSLGLSTNVGNAITFQTPNPKVPYNIRYSAGFQRAFGGWLAAVDYVGNHGVHLPVNQEFNPVPAQYLSTFTGGFDLPEYLKLTAAVTNPFYGVLPSTSSVGSSKVTNVAGLLRPYPEFGSVTSYVDSGTSMYHSLQAQLIRRFSNGASFTSAFTWSKSLDATQFLNASDTRPWYGLSSNDRTFRLALSGIYELPFGSGRRFLNGNRLISAVVGGWQAQGVYQVQSGQPLSFTPSTGSGPLYLGSGSPGSSNWGRAAYKRSIPGPGQAGYWFDTSKFVTNTAYTVTAGQPLPNPATAVPNQYQIRTFPIRFDNLRGDFLNQADVGVQRNFHLYESLQMQFRGEAINLLNHPVYALPNTDWTNRAFGQITSQANQPRVYQFSAFVRF